MSLASIDQAVSNVLADWGITTTILALALAAYLLRPVVFPHEPDTHPLLLARQAVASPVRNKGESAVYRSPEVPHGYPLRTGLNVKDLSAPRWAAGKDGDVRDIWREVQRGGKTGGDGKQIPRGSILSVFGKEELVEHDVDELSKEISTIGNHFQQAGIKKVAIYLPNSVEYLLTIFAASFYGVTPILLPYNISHPKLYHYLSGTGAEGLVCAAGNLPLDELSKSCKNIRLLTWVVEKTSRHMGWNGVPDHAADRLVVSVWHELVEENRATATTELPDNGSGDTPGDLVTVWQPADPAMLPQIVPFTQTNIVAAIAALITAIPMRQRLSSADLVLPADTLTHSYVLCQTLAALYMHCSLALTSVAGPGVDMPLARPGLAPTVVIASAETLAQLHQQESAGISSRLQRWGKYMQDQTVAAGRMPTDGLLLNLLAPPRPGKLRLILTSDRLGAGSPPLTSTMLNDLRILTRSRIVYALTTARVAGAVAQPSVFDYRTVDGTGASHFGVPLGSVEIKYLNSDEHVLSSAEPSGKLVVMGPAVAGGEVRLDVNMKIRADGCMAYA